jgi:light-regulated signal transduction histidine kinase (bacteriophytochrome)
MESNSMAQLRELARQDLAVQALLAGLTDFCARAGHDLVGPLNQAGSLLTLFVQRHRNQPDPEADTLLDFLQSASSRMEDVAEGIRRYLEVAARIPDHQQVDLNSSLAASLRLLAKSISDSAAAVSSDFLPVVSADSLHMVTIFEALIGNSIKFRSPDVLPRVHISARRAGDAWAIAVADNGIGIDREFIETAFLPFKRLNGREYRGAGLGLAMAKMIAELHCGKIWFEPVPEHAGPGGTCVAFTVPPR